MGGKGKGEIESEIGKVRGMAADAPTMETGGGWQLFAQG